MSTTKTPGQIAFEAVYAHLPNLQEQWDCMSIGKESWERSAQAVLATAEPEFEEATGAEAKARGWKRSECEFWNSEIWSPCSSVPLEDAFNEKRRYRRPIPSRRELLERCRELEKKREETIERFDEACAERDQLRERIAQVERDRHELMDRLAERAKWHNECVQERDQLRADLSRVERERDSLHSGERERIEQVRKNDLETMEGLMKERDTALQEVERLKHEQELSKSMHDTDERCINNQYAKIKELESRKGVGGLTGRELFECRDPHSGWDEMSAATHSIWNETAQRVNTLLSQRSGPAPKGKLTGRDIHREWRDGMLGQKRHVAESRMKWETLDEADHVLDDLIAERLNAIAGPARRATPEDMVEFYNIPGMTPEADADWLNARLAIPVESPWVACSERMPKEGDADRNGNVEWLWNKDQAPKGKVESHSWNRQFMQDCEPTHWRHTNLPETKPEPEDAYSAYHAWLRTKNLPTTQTYEMHEQLYAEFIGKNAALASKTSTEEK